MTGAAGGAILGALVGWGASRQHILKYEEHVKGGKYLVVAHGSADEVAKAQSVLEGTQSHELDAHAPGERVVGQLRVCLWET